MERFLEDVGSNVQTFFTIFDSITDLIFIIESDGTSFRYVYANHSTSKVLQSGKNIVGKRVEEIVPKEHASRMISYYNKVILTRKSIELIQKIVTSEGEMIGETSLNPLIQNGQVRYIIGIVRDITERKRKEQENIETKRKLEKSQKRLSSLVEHNSDAIYESDLQGNFISINKVITEITGFRTNELVGKSITNFIVEEYLEETTLHFRKAVSGRNEEYETWIYTKSGEKVHLNVKNVPIIVDGIVVGVYGIAQDITEKSRLETRLKESEQRYKSLFENHPEAIFSFDLNGNFTSGNLGVEKVTGYSFDELIGTSFIPLVDSNDLERTLFHFKQTIEQKKSVNYEIRLKPKHGHSKEVLITNIPIIVDNHVVGVHGIAKDITEIKKAQKELQTSEEKFRLITENAFDVIKMINPQGVIEYVSPSNEKILGYSSLEYVGQLFTKYIHPDDIPIIKKRFEGFLKGAKPTSIEIRLRHKKGHYIWLEITTTPIIEQGEVIQLVTVARDVTEKKKHRDELAKMAFYDYLTDLPNRRTFDDRLEMAIRNANRSNKKVALMMIDGRKFKLVNDTFGHDAGDAVLIEMARRLKACVRETDTVARFGGDEIGVILPEIDSVDIVEDIAKRIIDSFEKPLIFKHHQILLGAGIGIALYPDHTMKKKNLIKFADEALYRAKESNYSDYFIFHENI
ncbi:hypothetical protein BLX88_13700 [Bacillus obstructivus]|uniref:sensor domain-containing protein n=1 Tax=Heyndrickxia oleronia TaxID=38875 RepID=UPI0009043636|nr:hypothetical protein BLX88_13700 [Bacillus obstructivus]